MSENFSFHTMLRVLHRPPQAAANVRGSSAYPAIFGRVYFYQMDSGVLVAVRVAGLPRPVPDSPGNFFAFHIHSGGRCSGTAEDPFADASTHHNPAGAPHPDHAGDLPPLLGSRRGHAFQVFFTDRFSIREILHKTVVIHAGPDDFTSQPAGNAGEKIACGQIERFANADRLSWKIL